MRKIDRRIGAFLAACCLCIGCGKMNDDATKKQATEQVTEEAVDQVKRMGGISPEEALEYMKNTENLVIVEVNTEVWKKETPFMNALWIPHDEMAERYDEIPKECPVILHCGAGVVSVPAYETLVEKRPDIPELSYIDGAPPIAEYNAWYHETHK